MFGSKQVSYVHVQITPQKHMCVLNSGLVLNAFSPLNYQASDWPADIRQI